MHSIGLANFFEGANYKNTQENILGGFQSKRWLDVKSKASFNVLVRNELSWSQYILLEQY